jgi:PAS domain S-box-containing protein
LTRESTIAGGAAGENFTGLEAEPRSGMVLVIDDDEATLGLMRDLLEINGYLVTAAAGGAEGLELFYTHNPHVVITDIRMPHVDGLEVLRRLRESDDTVAVILVTGHGDLDHAIKALRTGAYDFLQKPINADILLSTVRQGMEHCRLKRFAKDYTQVLEAQVEERTRELADTNDFLRGILESSTGVSIVLTDFEDNVLFWNKGAEKIYGYTAEEMLGSLITRIYTEEDRRRKGAGASFKPRDKEYVTVQKKTLQTSKDGRRLTISLTLSPMLDASGAARGRLGLGLDVTEEARLHEELLESYRRIQRIQHSSIFALAKLAESRDGETAHHLVRLQEYCRLLCRNLKTKERFRETLTFRFIDDIVQSSILHDIGKVALQDDILFHQGKFGADEFEQMKKHAEFGGKALEEAAEETGEDSFLSMGRDIAYYHHERWDGKGYPYGLKGEAIPISARITAVADVYDALTSERRYKKAFAHAEAVAVIVAEKSGQFDPAIVEAFLEVESEFRRIRERISGDGAEVGPMRASAVLQSWGGLA